MWHQFPLNDPETKEMIKGAMRERRKIEAGKMTLKEAIHLPPGTTVDNNGKVELPASVGLSILFVVGSIVTTFIAAVVLFHVINAAIIWVATEYQAPTIRTHVLVALFAAPTGLLLFWLREFVRHELYGMLEAAFGIATALQVLRPDASGLVRIVALIAGIRIVVDGIHRWWTFSGERALAKGRRHKT
ncbi:MAG: hypothetical protein AB7F09_03200 [Parvibaculaceae bacterium]